VSSCLTNDATVPVGSFPADASPYGLLDMAGNVAEYADPDDGDESYYFVRGGAYYVIAENLACATRLEFATDGSSRDVGFRVALGGD
jgi:formylglycine-generating enzyme required for sulfatase activity